MVFDFAYKDDSSDPHF